MSGDTLYFVSVNKFHIVCLTNPDTAFHGLLSQTVLFYTGATLCNSLHLSGLQKTCLDFLMEQCNRFE